jgi:hypothetical protein
LNVVLKNTGEKNFLMISELKGVTNLELTALLKILLE